MFLASLIDRALEGRTAIAPLRASRYEVDVNMDEGPRGEAVAEGAPDARPDTDRSVTLEPVLRPTTPHAIEAEVPHAVRATQAPLQAAPPRVVTPARGEPPAIVTRLEQLAPAVEPTAQARPVIRPAPTAPAAERQEPAIREVHTHEHVEVRHEPREIERRLETLTREHLIERIARVEAASEAPSAPTTLQAAAPPPVAEPMRPRAVQPPPPAAPPSRREALPNVLAAPPEAPAQTVVHVSIGRVEVRNTAPPTGTRSPSRAREPRTGLDDYLRRREQA